MTMRTMLQIYSTQGRNTQRNIVDSALNNALGNCEKQSVFVHLLISFSLILFVSQNAQKHTLKKKQRKNEKKESQFQYFLQPLPEYQCTYCPIWSQSQTSQKIRQTAFLDKVVHYKVKHKGLLSRPALAWWPLGDLSQCWAMSTVKKVDGGPWQF